MQKPGKYENSFLLYLSLTFILLAGMVIRLYIAPSDGSDGYEGDLIEYKQAIHRAITQGMHTIYEPNVRNDPAFVDTWNGGYFITNPPCRIYAYYPSIMIYKLFNPAAFDLWNSDLNFFVLLNTDLHERFAKSRGYSVAVKLPAILADLLISLGLVFYLLPRIGYRLGLAAAAAYAFSPGIIIASAHFGNHDAVWIGLVTLSLFLICRGRIALSWTVYTLAVLTKPQPGAFALLILFLGLKRGTFREIGLSALMVIVTVILAFLPFIIHGNFLSTIYTLYRDTIGGQPSLSLQALNFWWLAGKGNALEMSDIVPLIGPLTPRDLGLLAFVMCNLFVLSRLRAAVISEDRIYFAAALIGMSFFMVNTEMHENYMMAVLPLTAFALPGDRKMWFFFIILSLTFIFNLIIFDPFTMKALMPLRFVEILSVNSLKMIVALLNGIVFLGMGTFFWIVMKRPVTGQKTKAIL